MAQRSPPLWWSALTASLVLLAGLAACAPAPPSARSAESASLAPAVPAAGPAAGTGVAAPAPNARLQTLVDAARREGQLSVVWATGVFGGQEGMPRITDSFNRHYGLDVTLQFTPRPGSAEVATRLIREHQAGRQAITDLISTPVDQTVALLRADAVETVDWASWAPHLQDPQLVAPGGGAVAAVSYFPGITYNSNRLKGAEVPTSLHQLLEPTYKGRIASTPYAAWFNYLGASEGWGAPRMTEYLTRFADQVSGLIRCNEKERLLSGEFDVLAIDCSHGEALLLKREGAPIDVSLASDIPYVGTRYIAIPRGAPHPSVAKLWVDFLMSREAQDILYELELADNIAVPGSRSARDVEAVQGARGKLIPVDVEFYERNDETELNRLLTLSQQMLRKQ